MCLLDLNSSVMLLCFLLQESTRSSSKEVLLSKWSSGIKVCTWGNVIFRCCQIVSYCTWKKFGFVVEVCFNSVQIFWIWSVNCCVWMPVWVLCNMVTSLHFVFSEVEIWHIPFLWNWTDNNNKKPVLKCAILYEIMLNYWWWELGADFYFTFICFDWVKHVRIWQILYLNNLHKQKTQTTLWCQHIYLFLSCETHSPQDASALNDLSYEHLSWFQFIPISSYSR